jgi:hypothetical protein
MMIDWTDWLMIDDHDRDGRRGMYGPGKVLGDAVSSFSCTLSCIARESGINNLPMLHNLFYLIFQNLGIDVDERSFPLRLSRHLTTSLLSLQLMLIADRDNETRVFHLHYCRIHHTASPSNYSESIQ